MKARTGVQTKSRMESRYAAAERRSGQQKSRRKTSLSTNWRRRIDPTLGSQGIQTKLRQTTLRDTVSYRFAGLDREKTPTLPTLRYRKPFS